MSDQEFIDGTRRTFLKTAAAGATTAGFGTTAAAATGLGGPTQYRGIAYDTRTHDVVGPAKATVRENGESVDAVVRAGPYELDFEHAQPNRADGSPEGARRLFLGTQDDGKLPLETKLENHSDFDFLSGYFTRPSPQYGKLGVALLPEVRAGDERSIAGALMPKTSPRKLGYDRGIPVYDPISRVDPQPSGRVGSTGVTTDSVSTTSDDYVAALSEDDEYIYWEWDDYNERCGTSFEAAGTYQLVTQADSDSDGQGADEVTTFGENQWVVQAYYPYRLKHDRVDLANEHTGVASLEFHGQVGYDDSYADYEAVELNSPEPSDSQLEDGDTSNIDVSISGGVDILDPVPFLSVGMSLSYGFDSKSGSTFVNGPTINGTDWDTNNYLYWDIQKDQHYTDVPKEPNQDGAWTVKFDVTAYNTADTYETVTPKGNSTWWYYAYELDACPSAYYGVTALYDTTPLVEAPNTFEVV